MNNQNQWLFEVPVATSTDLNLVWEAGWHPEATNAQWGQELEAAPRTRASNRVTQQRQSNTSTPAACANIGSPEILNRFAYDKDILAPQHQQQIQKIAECVLASYNTAYPIQSLRLVGHTDPSGPDTYNLQLGQRRAEQVRNRLQQAIKARNPELSRRLTITVETRGEREPVAQDAALNRRVEVFLNRTQTSNKPPKPLRIQEVQKTIKPRPPVKSAANLAIALPLTLPTSAAMQITQGRARANAEMASGLASTPTLLIQGVVGQHAVLPKCQVKTLQPSPRQQLKALQQQFHSLPGYLPDHLPLLPMPRKLPDELRAKPRINVNLPKRLPKGVHAPTTVFAPDDRKVFKDTAYPWSTVGLVETAGGRCSGVMVGPRHLLTCSHGIQWLAGGSSGWIKFTPAYFDGGVPAFGFAYGVMIYSLKKVDGSDGIDREEGQYDYAVVVLNSRIGDLSGWMGVRSWSDDWDNQPYWNHIGYPGDLTSGQRPTFEHSIPLDGSFWDREVHTRIFHKGDVYPGQSGGPFFAWWAGQSYPQVVAVQSSQTSDENAASGGADMLRLVADAKRDYP